MRDDLAALNGFVEALRHESSAFDFPHRGKQLVADRELLRGLVLDILRGTPSERFAAELFPLLNLVDEELLLCALAAADETEITRCPVVVVDAAGETPYLLASSFQELVGLFPWGHRLLVEIAVHVTTYARRKKKGTMKAPQQKFAARVAKRREQLDPELPRRLGVDVAIVADPVAAIARAHERHRARLQCQIAV